MTERSDRPYIVQFPHPGGEYRPRGDEMDWNRGPHHRKFLKATGSYLDADGVQGGPITFWGEWEPQSRVVESFPPGLRDGPRRLHQPWWDVPRHRRLLQNTDPLVFGDRFRYSNCRQTRNAALRRLPPGSLVLFGSALRGAFVLDTVFVVARQGVHYLRGAPDHLDVPDWVRSVVFDPLRSTEDRGHEALRLYEGVRHADDPSGPYCFVPCRPYVPGDGAFARPVIELDRRWLTPRLSMGAKATEARPDDVRSVWAAVVDQVVAAGLCLGVELDVPPDAPTSRLGGNGVDATIDDIRVRAPSPQPHFLPASRRVP